MSSYYFDPDPAETTDWLQSLDGVIETEGKDKADYLLRTLTDRAREKGVSTSPGILTPYCNTIPPDQETPIPEESFIARNVAAYVRWNAMAMVARPWAVILQPTHRFLPFSRWDSTGFFAVPMPRLVLTWSISRDTVPQECTHALLLKAGWTNNISSIFARRLAAMAFPPTLIRGSCPISGSSPLFPWDYSA